MDERLIDLRSKKNPKARIKIMQGHFATQNSHVNTYIDMSTIKTRHNNARETAYILADEYITNTMVDTIVCLKNMQVVGTFMAERLADSNNMSLSSGNNISVVTPEFDATGQIFFRDSNERMISGKHVLILTDSMSTGQMARQAIESVLYYGGTVCGICSVFSSISRVAGLDVKTIFTSSDLPSYHAYTPHECPMCKREEKIDGLINAFGYTKL